MVQGHLGDQPLEPRPSVRTSATLPLVLINDLHPLPGQPGATGRWARPYCRAVDCGHGNFCVMTDAHRPRPTVCDAGCGSSPHSRPGAPRRRVGGEDSALAEGRRGVAAVSGWLMRHLPADGSLPHLHPDQATERLCKAFRRAAGGVAAKEWLETISKLGGGQPMKSSIPQQTTRKLNQAQVIERVLVVPHEDSPGTWKATNASAPLPNASVCVFF